MSIGEIVSGEIRSSGEFPRTRMSPDEWLCGTRCKADSSSVASRIESGAEHISFDLAGDSISINIPSISIGAGVEISTGAASPSCLSGR